MELKSPARDEGNSTYSIHWKTNNKYAPEQLQAENEHTTGTHEKERRIGHKIEEARKV